MMPQSVLVKIQFGGLLGLQRHIPGQPPAANRVDDIDALITAAAGHFAGIESIPYDLLVDDIIAWKLPRRRGR